VFEVILPDFAEGYHEDTTAWKYLLDLLDVVDRRWAAGREIATGEILTVLLLPLLSRRMGWHQDGVAQRPRGTNVRDLADDMLRPLALRLRVARKDQEYCRQCLMTLYRMVPVQNLRSSSRQAIVQRPCMSGCLWILEAVGQRLGGDFSKAFEYWSSSEAPRPGDSDLGQPRRTRPARTDGEADSSEATRPRKRRRRRRSGKRAPEESAREPAPSPSATQPPQDTRPPKDNMPPPWDDGYFFAALPSVPETSVGDGGDDRYGSSSLTGSSAPTSESSAPTSEPSAPASEPSAPGGESSTEGPNERPTKPRRRRRRRRSRPSSATGEGGGSTES
jgi:hypothetical protein